LGVRANCLEAEFRLFFLLNKKSRLAAVSANLQSMKSETMTAREHQESLILGAG
jgi:hypothetical protein